MKLINQAFVFLSLIGLHVSHVEAKSLEFLFDHTTQETFILQTLIPNHIQEGPSLHTFTQDIYSQQLKVENIGDTPLQHCFPFINQSPSFTLEDLASKLVDEPYPLLTLYQLWNHSLIKNEEASGFDGHPLDLLNFAGICSQEIFNNQFLKLCNALGFNLRLANIHGKTHYDFGLDGDWHFLDLSNQQFYVGFDNEKIVSSEEIMDDPLLALRMKHHREAKQMDFKKAWEELAHFEILEPASAEPIAFETDEMIHRADGFDLYPGETLIFKTPCTQPELANHQRYLEHTIDLEARQVPSDWTYLSPFPIHTIKNQTAMTMELLDQKVELQPGEIMSFEQHDLFEIHFKFAHPPKGQLVLSSLYSYALFPSLVNGHNQLHLGAKENKSVIRLSYEVDEALEGKSRPAPQILNKDHSFSYQAPQFFLGNASKESEEIEKIWWQIARDPHFHFIPSNLDQTDSFSSCVSLPVISETFLNPGDTYYFRVKGYSKGQWSEWSTPFAFVVDKPARIEEVEFEAVDGGGYELNWERWAEELDGSIEYLVFGSNSLDFIPSIYYDKQVNAIVDGVVTDEEVQDNLVGITLESNMRINGSLAYYRIIARKNGQLSTPSSIIHLYDQHLIQPRNTLQLIDDEEHILAKRLLFPASQPWIETSLPHISVPHSFASPLSIPTLSHHHYQKNNLLNLQFLLRSAVNLEKEKLTKEKYSYEFPHVSKETWDEVSPYLLPENHPAWPKLNRIFCQSRAIQNPDTFKKAGFNRWRPGRLSRVSASSHPECKEYFIKAYCDCELGILYDWRKWIHRIEGAETIRQCIKRYKLQENFKVPRKWIYPLPRHPSPPNNSHYLRKNFILVTENMRIQEHKTNEKAYKKKFTRDLMDGLYIVLQVCGLYDSVFVFNIPFCKDGRIAVIDTEYHHKWPVPFQKLTTKFSKDLQSYWQKITFNGGRIPDGINQPNPPRMDRRDHK